jgi:hypothetical protein
MFTVQLKNPQVVKLVSFIIYTCPKCSLSDKPFIRIFGYHQGTVQVTVISLPTALREKKHDHICPSWPPGDINTGSEKKSNNSS